MSNEMYQLIAIIIYMAAMIFIGWYAFKRTSNLTDYMLGGRSLGPAVTALSAGAADMSGWLLMGLPGAIFLNGLVETWIAVGLTVGAYLNYVLVAPRLRVYTQVSSDSITIPSYLESRLKDKSRLLRIASGIVILIFFTFYVSSGMVAGGKFFLSSFGLDYHAGLLIVSAVVIFYTLFGGFLAVSYTDVVQGLIMFLSLLLIPIFGLFLTGGFSETAASIRDVDPQLLNFVSGASFLGILSAVAWGLGYFGQPHIIVRFMAISSVKEIKGARRIGIGWMLLSLFGAVATALVGIAYYHQSGTTLNDAETVFIALGQIIFHPFIAGIMLAAVLAAVMSTISSQLIVTSSALIEDLYKAVIKTDASDKQYVFYGRIAVLLVSIVAMILAWPNNDTVLKIVSFAWAGFGASFGPIILLSLYWRKITAKGALWGMITGAVTVLIWGNVNALSSTLYEIVPGFILCWIVTYLVSLATYQPNAEIDREFSETVEILKKER
ncbi:sodium/proline symporter PutP [Pseudobacillus badius]|uniref:sodium/proline symporter PutP n=1 Tax=Bacillus badius TaxID=1455 RepID=UPI0007B05B0E|nr:sodium/proline symporter PutP [Bacillus badius]KZO00992.1 sodium:proline symporter [Bacillus badius]OCS89029.1 sodium/proline symporter [Bacillus badius]OVE48193.1 sodium/proline symporter [Bacillus badius]TDW00495.1 sodium/proline symporter [Bacillus badius]UAT31199.1 sodium/proline symporter PutP [Bacillus badius]